MLQNIYSVASKEQNYYCTDFPLRLLLHNLLAQHVLVFNAYSTQIVHTSITLLVWDTAFQELPFEPIN